MTAISTHTTTQAGATSAGDVRARRAHNRLRITTTERIEVLVGGRLPLRFTAYDFPKAAPVLHEENLRPHYAKGDRGGRVDRARRDPARRLPRGPAVATDLFGPPLWNFVTACIFEYGIAAVLRCWT